MAFYVVILDDPSEQAWGNVKREFSQHHFLNDRTAFIKESDALTADIAKKVGIGTNTVATGIVVQMDYYSGHTNQDLVEWVSKNQ